MIRKSIVTAAVLGVAALGMTNVSQAFFGNMMNPSRWFDNDDDDYYYRRGGYGPYGYGPYGGYGGPYGWGGPWGGGPYGGYGGYGGYGRPSTIVVNPSEGSRQAPPRTPE